VRKSDFESGDDRGLGIKEVQSTAPHRQPRKGGFDRYKRHCDAVAAKGYEGFKFSKQKTPVT
jgi:hypothetical protein